LNGKIEPDDPEYDEGKAALMVPGEQGKVGKGEYEKDEAREPGNEEETGHVRPEKQSQSGDNAVQGQTGENDFPQTFLLLFSSSSKYFR
jgi:hypothetical protein